VLTKTEKNKAIEKLVGYYDFLVKGIDVKAKASKERAYGGVIRAGKGLFVESLTRELFALAWSALNNDPDRLRLKRKPVRIQINEDYIKRLKDKKLKGYIKKNLKDYYYNYSPDVPVCVDNKLIIAVECKAYTENAMLKRILVDFTLLKKVFPKITFILLQLESQLGGDYSKSLLPRYGSYPTHTLLSYFDIDLHVLTLLEGERKVNKPIHKTDYYKPLNHERLEEVLDFIKSLF
jgi:hypothetical protein